VRLFFQPLMVAWAVRRAKPVAGPDDLEQDTIYG